MSREDDVASSVVCTVCGFEYEAGASTAPMLMVPAVSGITRVEACPLRSVRTVQLLAPLHAEKETAGVAVKNTLAPLTGVTPSTATTLMRIGFTASPPTGVAGFDPATSLIVSVGPAP